MSSELSTKLAAAVMERDRIAANSEAARLKAFDQEIAEMRAQLDAKAEADQRGAGVAELAMFADQGAQALSDYESERGLLAKAMTTHLAALASAKDRMQQARARFIARASELTEGAPGKLASPRTDVDESRRLEVLLADLLREVEACDSDLAGVLIADFFPGKTGADRPYSFADLGPMGPLVELAIGHCALATTARPL